MYPTRTPGGSSGGTGASIACNIGIIGLGTDTINSVRSPSSANSLVGIRPTIGLVSRAGIVPSFPDAGYRRPHLPHRGGRSPLPGCH